MKLWPRIRRAMMGAVLVPMLAGCAHHQPVLQLPRLQVGHATFASTVAAYTGSAVVGGNRVAILLNGDEIFPAKLAESKHLEPSHGVPLSPRPRSAVELAS